MIAVCVPWTGGDRWRERSKRATVAHWQAAGWPVFLSDTTTRRGPPNRARARNEAIRKAFAAGADVVLLVDSDTQVSHSQVEAAASTAIAAGGPVFPFDTFLKVRQQRSHELLKPSRPDNWEQMARIDSRELLRPCSGALVVPASVFDVVGLYDERFTSWGCEDRCFLVAVETLVRPSVRQPGFAYHWWHPRAADRDVMGSVASQLQLAGRYRRSAGYLFDWPHGAKWPRSGPEVDPVDPDPEAMAAILAEPGGPLA